MRIIILFFLCLQLAACASGSEVKAPCDYYGHFCGQKTHINS